MNYTLMTFFIGWLNPDQDLGLLLYNGPGPCPAIGVLGGPPWDPFWKEKPDFLAWLPLADSPLIISMRVAHDLGLLVPPHVGSHLPEPHLQVCHKIRQLQILLIWQLHKQVYR
jgi:hypothetical protein